MASPPTATPPQPPPLQPFQPSPFVPALLETTPQWICWKAVWRANKGKWDKLPVSVVTGSGVGFLDAKNQVSYDEAIRYAERHGLSGVGFVLMGSEILGIDLDSCRDPATGELEPWASTILGRARTYAEISPSLRGIRLFTLGDLGGKSMIKSSPAKVEMYASGRYLTFTGNHLPGSPYDVEPDPQTIQALKDRVDKIQLLTGSPAPAGTPAPAASQGPGDLGRYAYSQTFFGKVNKLAMENLPKWVPELFPTAERMASGVWRVKSKDLGRDLEEDISISPAGIVDFGEHDMGDERQGKRTPVDLTILWHGKLDQEDQDPEPLGKTEAVLWLCKKLGVDPSSLGYRGVAVDNGDNGDSPGTTGTELDDVLPGNRQAAAPDDAETIDDAMGTLASPGFQHEKQEIIAPGFVRGEATLVAGPTGAMKSLLMAQLSVAIVSGQARLLGAATIDYCGSVVFYSNEDAPKQLMKRLDAIQRHHNLVGKASAMGTLSIRTQHLLRRQGEAIVFDKRELAALGAIAAKRETALVVVDTLAAAVGSKETNDEFQQTMNLLKSLAARLNVSIAVTHHFRKGQPGFEDEDDETPIDNIRGGSSLSAAARLVLMVEKPRAREAAKYGMGDGRAFMKLTEKKDSYNERGPVRWFKLETADVAVTDKRNGSPGMEKAPALVAISPDAAAAWLGVLQKALGDLGRAQEALGRIGLKPRWLKKISGDTDSVTTITGLEVADAGRVLDELEDKGAVRRVWNSNKRTTYVEVIDPDALNQPEENDDESGEYDLL